MGKPEGKRPLGSPRRRQQNNIMMDLREVGWSVWAGLMWLLIGTSEHGNEASDFIKYW
jgi:hypothetical protein